MSVNYDYEKVTEAIDQLRELNEDTYEYRRYIEKVINNETDNFIRQYILDHYDILKQRSLAEEISEKLKIYIDWLNDANIRARQVELKNELKAGETPNGGDTNPSGQDNPSPSGQDNLTQDPNPSGQDNPNPAPSGDNQEEPKPNGEEQPDNENETNKDEQPQNNNQQQSGGGNYQNASSSLNDIKEKLSESNIDTEKKTTLKDLNETAEKETTTTEYQTIPTYTTQQYTRNASQSGSSTTSSTSATSKTTSGASKTVIAAGAVGLAGTMAGTGLLVGKALQAYKFSPNDWDELDPAEQERITNTLYRVGYKDKEINAIMNSTFKIERSELNVHIKKIENAISNYNKFSEEFQKIYKYSLVSGGEVSKYLTFLTMIVDGKSISDQYNMYNIINKYLDDLEEVDKTYQGIRAQDYME